MHRLDDGPSDGEPVISRRAAADLIENDQAAGTGLGENRGSLDHLHHERGAAARQIIRRADAAEQPVDDADFGSRRRHETSRLGEHGDQRGLPKKGRFAAHVGPGDQPQPVVGAH